MAFVYGVGFCRVLGSINMEIAYRLEHTLYLLTSIKDTTRLIAENGFDSRLVCAGIPVKYDTGTGLLRVLRFCPLINISTALRIHSLFIINDAVYF